MYECNYTIKGDIAPLIGNTLPLSITNIKPKILWLVLETTLFCALVRLKNLSFFFEYFFNVEGEKINFKISLFLSCVVLKCF